MSFETFEKIVGIRVLYMIREKGTNRFLPECRRGYSFSNLESGNSIPRLFKEHGHATLAMKAWKQGEFTTCHFTSYEGEEDFWVEPKHVPERDSIELEIIPVILQEFKN